MEKRIRIGLGGCFLVWAFVLACDVDSGLDFGNPTARLAHGIKGRLIFSGQWPTSYAEVRVVTTASFPPDPANPLDAFVFSDPIRLGVRSVDYALTLAPGTYRIVAVIFREHERPWDIGNILAVYAPLAPCTILPDLSKGVTVASDTSIVEGVDVFVDLTKGSFSGTVRFEGEWPAEIGFAGVLAFEAPLDFNNLIPCGLAVLPVGVREAAYRVVVPASDYVLLIVAGRDLGSVTNLTDVSIIGTYFAPEDSTRPGVVRVQQQANTAGVDMVAHLNVIRGAR